MRKIEFNSMRKENRDYPVYCPGAFAKRFSLEGKLSHQIGLISSLFRSLNSENNVAIAEILNALFDFNITKNLILTVKSFEQNDITFTIKTSIFV